MYMIRTDIVLQIVLEQCIEHNIESTSLSGANGFLTMTLVI